MTLSGCLAKMPCRVEKDGQVHYQLPLGTQLCELNPLIGQKLTLHFTGRIACVHCGVAIKKSYQQGYCFLATQKLAQCDLCILKPELCHHHQGTCREPQWGNDNCMQPHIVYLANASGIKVGITRIKNVPSRWVDQGASQALPIAKVTTRRIAGLLEVALGQYVADKTNWRKMLKNDVETLDLAKQRDHLLSQVWDKVHAIQAKFGDNAVKLLDEKTLQLTYPVKQYPANIKSFNFDKNPLVEGKLLGIKGQYLIFDGGVINVRKFSGYEVELAGGAEIKTASRDVAKPVQRCPFAR